ncbi:baseplate assembly protein [Azospirillum argentinense]
MRYDAIDLSKLPKPAVIEQIDYETILAARKATMAQKLAGILPGWNPDLESDPIVAQLEELAYYELLMRQRVNDAGHAVMLAYATGADLDQLAANFHVMRQVIDPGDPLANPPRPRSYEDDTRLRSRIQMAMEGLSTAGPAGAYVFHALGADPRVSDVSVYSPTPGTVVVTILSAAGNGVATPDLLNAVQAVLSSDDVRPLTDKVTVQAAQPVTYTVTATLELYQGPDTQVVRDAAAAAVQAFVMKQRRLGELVTIDGLHAALRAEGVRRVTLAAPLTGIETAPTQYPLCTGINVQVTA